VVLDELDVPIVQAPMGGGPSTVALAVAVGEAGALGFLAGGYLTTEAMRAEIRALHGRTERPFGVNVFVPDAGASDPAALEAYLRRLSGVAEHYGVALGEPHHSDEDWSAKLEVLGEERPAVASFTFGCPPPEAIAALRARGISVWVTVTGPDEARIAAAAGADALVVQGVEAGGHQASFEDSDRDGLGLLALLRLIAAETDVPLIGAGGVGDGAALAAVLAAGALAAQVGTAFMLAPEAGTHPAHRARLGTNAPTGLTRAWSGRQARGIVNAFQAEHSADAPRAYPQVHHATSPLRVAARERGNAEAFNLWAGQAQGLAVARPAAETVRLFAAEARQAAEAATARLGVGHPCPNASPQSSARGQGELHPSGRARTASSSRADQPDS